MSITVTDFDTKHSLVDWPNNVPQTDPFVFRVCFIYENFGVKGRYHEAMFNWRIE
jgi:hypothetical protein